MMPNVKVFTQNGADAGTMDLSEAVFGIEPNEVAMHSVVVNYLANQRHGTQCTRQGSIRAPQWRHGGIALGPKPRSYRFTLNKKVRRLAMLSAFSSKVAEGEMIVLDKLELEAIKTKAMVGVLNALQANGKALIITAAPNANVIKSAGNIQGVRTTVYNAISVYDILNCDKMIIVKDAVEKIEEVYAQ